MSVRVDGHEHSLLKHVVPEGAKSSLFVSLQVHLLEEESILSQLLTRILSYWLTLA